MAAGDRVTWSQIRQLASNVDSLYSRTVPNHRPYSENECVHQETTDSTHQGMPRLASDITTPFPTAFPVSKTFYQRFEFAYYNVKDGEYVYPKYYNREMRPVYHSEYLVNGYHDSDTTVVPPGAIGCSSAANAEHLIEGRLNDFWKWWPSCERYTETTTISAELYFVTDQGSVCPCPAIYRVAYAVAGGNNGNGNVRGANGLLPYTAYEGIHSWMVKDACTLEQIDFAKLKPEDCEYGRATYTVPPTGCCARAVFPTLGQEGGTGLTQGGMTMYDVRLFDRGFSFATTKPYTKVCPDMPLAQYLSREEAGTLPPHAKAEEPNMYDTYSIREMWKMCAEGVEAGIRVTPMRFIWRDMSSNGNNEVTDSTGGLHVSIVYVPTSVTIQLQGKLQPAIRKRWYDMIYHKLRHIVGCYPGEGSGGGGSGSGSGDGGGGSPLMLASRSWSSSWSGSGDGGGGSGSGGSGSGGGGGDFPEGTTWNEAGEKALAAYDKPCSRYLALGYGWSKHANDRYNEAQFYGEKYWEQMICVKNYSGGVACPGSGEWNKEPGCYCTPEAGKADDCQDLACTRPVIAPWEGGCENEQCSDSSGSGGGGASSLYKTHWVSYEYLNSIYQFAQRYKTSENLSNLTTTVPWDYCANKYKKGSLLSLPYTYMSYIINTQAGCWGGPTYAPQVHHIVVEGKLDYNEMDYDDMYCAPCMDGADCPFVISGRHDTGTMTLKPDGDVPVVCGMGYLTYLEKAPHASQHTLTIYGDISSLLIPGGEFKLRGDPDEPCVAKDTPSEKKKPDIITPNPGGVIDILVHYGPDGSEMKQAAPYHFERSSIGITELNASIPLSFSELQNHSYRRNIVIYVVAWCMGSGADTPFILCSSAFKPGSATLDVKLQ